MPAGSNLTRSAGAMGVMTLISRVFGYARDLLQASILGAADSADAFVIAFRIPNLFRRLVGEGALTAALVPVFTETRERQGEAAGWRLAATAFWTFGALLLVLTGLGKGTFDVWIQVPHWDEPLSARTMEFDGQTDREIVFDIR